MDLGSGVEAIMQNVIEPVMFEAGAISLACPRPSGIGADGGYADNTIYNRSALALINGKITRRTRLSLHHLWALTRRKKQKPLPPNDGYLSIQHCGAE